jgi:hypothetical protein
MPMKKLYCMFMKKDDSVALSAFEKKTGIETKNDYDA